MGDTNTALRAHTTSTITTTEEVTMDRPDLAALAVETQDIEQRITALVDKFREAKSATVGEFDEKTDEEISPGNGDSWDIFEQAIKQATDARFQIGQVITGLATQQGFREFDAAGIEIEI